MLFQGWRFRLVYGVGFSSGYCPLVLGLGSCVFPLLAFCVLCCLMGSCDLSGCSGGGLAFGVYCGMRGFSQLVPVLLLFVLAFLWLFPMMVRS
jgi:hypothetical protein